MTSPSPEILAILREIFEDIRSAGALPKEASLRVRLREQPWLLDELTSARLVRRTPGGHIDLTLEGLQALEGPDVAEELARSRQLYALLREAYVADPERNWGASALQKLPGWTGGDDLEIGRLLGRFAPQHVLGQIGYAPSGLVSAVTILDAIFAEDPFYEPPASLPEDDGSLTVGISNFLAVRQAEWSPEGVSLLVGANGAGKSSILAALGFLSTYLRVGLEAAIQQVGGGSGLRNIFAPTQKPIRLSLQRGQVTWEVQIAAEGASVNPNPGELVKLGDQVILRRALFANRWYYRTQQLSSSPGECCLGLAARRGGADAAALERLVSLVTELQTYPSYSLDRVRREAISWGGDTLLHPSGRNLYAVLRNWRSAPRQFSGNFEWVLRHLKLAFPDVVDNVEFPANGTDVHGILYLRDARNEQHSLPLHRASDGVLVGLLHLTAVAGVSPGGLVALDELENQLHPHAIRVILAAIRELAEDRALTVILTTHSPVVMNTFRETPEQFFILGKNLPRQPLALTEQHDEDALLQVQLGELYDRLDFAAPDLRPGSGEQ